MLDFWRFGGVFNEILFVCDQGVRTSVTIRGACDGCDVCHGSDGAGADAIRVKFYRRKQKTNIFLSKTGRNCEKWFFPVPSQPNIRRGKQISFNLK